MLDDLQGVPRQPEGVSGDALHGVQRPQEQYSEAEQWVGFVHGFEGYEESWFASGEEV